MTDPHGWQPIETAPRDGTVFIACQRDLVLAAFYKKNLAHNARRPVTLQTIWRFNRYTSAGSWFSPTHWQPLDPLPDPPEETP